MADHAGRSRRLASSVQHHPLRAVACDWPALLVCLAAPCMSRIPRGAKGEAHDYRLHHSGFDHYTCHLSHAPAQCRRLRLGGRRPVASAQAACIGSASALVAPMLDSGLRWQKSVRLSYCHHGPWCQGHFAEERRWCQLWLWAVPCSVNSLVGGAGGGTRTPTG